MRDVIIVGAGAAGLMAAKKLSEAGFKVIILEARDRIGGRIFTITNNDSSTPVEGGAEFIHGNLAVTLGLLKEAGIEMQKIKGNFINVINGNWKAENDFFGHAELVTDHLKSLEEDISIAAFLNRFFAEEKYSNLRKSLTSYVEGYYSGEIEKTSAKAFLAEWLNEDEQQFHPVGGYGKMIEYLAESCRKAGTEIHLSAVVKEIKWRKGNVTITDDNNNNFTASKVIITVPLGVLLAEKNTKGAITYLPELKDKMLAAKQLGFGSVIKVLVEFKNFFWEDKAVKNKIKTDTANLHMVLSNAEIPTWWTQLPQRKPMLTGWLSGPKAALMKKEKDEDVLLKALNSLSSIFKIETTVLEEKLKWWKIFNWAKDEFTLGSYSYSTLDTNDARKILAEPVENTIFFSGEALYQGPEMGTVEAALTGGIETAEKILLQ